MSPRPNPVRAKTKVATLDHWGWSAFFSQLAIVFGFLAFGLAHFAWADRGPGAADYLFKAQSNPIMQASISGEMNWKNGVGTLRDASSGKTYTLIHSESLKELWESGVKKISVSGQVGDQNTLTVEKVSAP